jgi:hypothetical protein
MTKTEFEVYSDSPNRVIARYPGRAFPGVLIQGDTLHNLVGQLMEVEAKILSSSVEAREALAEIREFLQSLVSHYADVLKENGFRSPF